MEKTQKELSRRKFLFTLTGTGALLMLNPFALLATEEADNSTASVVARTIGIDTHNHIDVPLHAAEFPVPLLSNLSGEMKKSGLSAICMTYALDYQKLSNTGEAYDRFVNGLNAMDAVLKSNNIERSLNMADIRSAHKKQKPTVIQSVEGAHFLEGHLDRLTVAYDRGLRHLTLLHDIDASVPLGDGYTNTPQWGGLTTFGTKVIKECNRLGILIDLSHANNETLDAALKISTSPVIISHTGLDTQLGKNESMAKMMRPRLISKEQAKRVADAGGLIGVWKHLAETPLEYAQNIRALVNVVGIEHVCIGSDTKLTPSYFAPTAKSLDTSDQTGNNDNNVGVRTNEAWKNKKEGFYHVVVEALLKTGFKEDEIALIGGGNFCRVFDAATKKH